MRSGRSRSGTGLVFKYFQMNTSDCSLTILVSRADRRYMMQTVPHLVKMLDFPFAEKLLMVDTAPLPARYDAMPHLGTLDELFELCEELRARGVVDRVLRVVHDDAEQLKLYHSHFSPTPRFTRNFRGYPNLACALAIEQTSAENHLWFDGDMLFYQTPGHGWVSKAMKLLAANDDVMFVGPLPGPPAPDGLLPAQTNPYTRDEGGFFRFKTFTSRRYLLNRARFKELLPLYPSVASRKMQLQSYLNKRSHLQNWEIMVSQGLEKSRFYRADTAAPDAWALHTPDHGDAFVEALPDIIERVERGEFPAAQGGDYDLRLPLWK